jgi:hypothetical protein
MYDIAEDNNEQAKSLWNNIKTMTLRRWPQHEIEINKLLIWIKGSYQMVGFNWAES